MSADRQRPDEPVFDDDNPEWTADDFARSRPADTLTAEILAQFPRTRGKQRAPTKVPVNLRLSRDVVERFKADGPGWQGRIDGVLRRALGL